MAAKPTDEVLHIPNIKIFCRGDSRIARLIFFTFFFVESTLCGRPSALSGRELDFAKQKPEGEKRKNIQNIFQKFSKNSRFPHPPIFPLLHRLTLFSPPIFLSIVLPMPLFSPNCVFKSTPEENFFQNFQKLFSSQTLIFRHFQNFFPFKCRPRHTFSRRKSTKNGQPAQAKLPKNYPHLAKISISEIPRKKYSKFSKKFQKRG